MRFTILTQYFPPEIGAAQTRLAAVAKEMRRLGHDVQIVTAMPHHLVGHVFSRYRKKIFVAERWHGMDVYRTWVYAATGTGIRRVLNYLSFTITSVFGLLKSRRSDYIFVESPPLFLCIPAWIVAKLRGSEIIFNVSDLWPDSVAQLNVITNRRVLRAAERLERWAYQHSRYVNGVTEGIKDALRTRKDVAPEKIRFLPNGIDGTHFRPLPPDTNIRARLALEGRTIVLYAGTHGVAQGLETLIEAAALLTDTNVTMLFVGDGPTKRRLQALVEHKHLSNVRFLDPQPLSMMPAIFSIAHLSIVPLVRNELFKGARPSKIFGSLASGVPVIYCGEGEGAELVEESGGGIAIPPESPRALAETIRELIASPDRRASMGEAGREYVVRRYGWPEIVKQWIDGIQLKGA